MQAKQSASCGVLALGNLSDVELQERGRGRQYNLCVGDIRASVGNGPCLHDA
jgi:hypothetical protein